MITAQDVYILDKNSEFFGVPTKTLMENAGKNIAFFVKTIQPQPKKILLLCGNGNNGGDGFVAAQHLSKKYTTDVYLVKPPKTELAQHNFKQLKNTSAQIIKRVDVHTLHKIFSSYDLIIDAMLGVGVKGTLQPPYDKLVQQLNESKVSVLSVDVPTGLGTNTSVHPMYTVTFHDVKEGMNENTCGQIHITDIGIPKEAINNVGPGQLSILYPRPQNTSHKGKNGSVLVIGGGPYCGAPALSALAALRTGVDLVHVATPKNSWLPIASFSPNLIVHPLTSDILTESDIPLLKNLLKKCTTVVLGPGLGEDQDTKKTIIQLIKIISSLNISLVLDADALLPSTLYPSIKKTSTVLTPHGGEFTTLTGVILPDSLQQRTMLVKQWAQKLGVSLVVKGPVDIITDGYNIKQNIVHNPAMTVGGTGDVLSGIIAGLLSKGLSGFDAGCLGTFINGAAGNQAFSQFSYGLLATDILDLIPVILKNYL